MVSILFLMNDFCYRVGDLKICKNQNEKKKILHKIPNYFFFFFLVS